MKKLSSSEANAPRYAAIEGKKRGTPRKLESTTLIQVPLLLPQREKVADGRMRALCCHTSNRDYDEDLPRFPPIRTTRVHHEGALIRPPATFSRCDGRRGTRTSFAGRTIPVNP